MKGRIQRWGNSLGVRIPRAVAEDAALYEGSEVDLRVEEGRVVLDPTKPKKYALSDLLAGVTDENIHGERATGEARGNEEW